MAKAKPVPTAPVSIVTEVLATASKIVTGIRTDTHGSPEDSFQAIANYWNAYLKNKPGIYYGVIIDDEPVSLHAPLISPADVAQMMVLLKIARFQTGQPVFDHFVDEAGYAALAGQLSLDNPEV